VRAGVVEIPDDRDVLVTQHDQLIDALSI